jgi:hypothetical protein
MDKVISSIRNYFSSKKSHWLYPLLCACASVVFGLLKQPWVGAIFLIGCIYLVLAIFIPWHKIIKKRQTLAVLLYPQSYVWHSASQAGIALSIFSQILV